MESDPSGQLAWLASELEAAETAGERVWLMGHMPLGSGDAFHDQSQYFGRLIHVKVLPWPSTEIYRSNNPTFRCYNRSCILRPHPSG